MIPRKIVKEIEKLKVNDQKIVLIGGCFDLIHPGHITFLKKSKNAGNVLIVLLESDQSMVKSGKNPAHNQKERLIVLESIRYVDYVISLRGILHDANYYAIVKKIKPDIIAVTESDPQIVHKKIQADSVGAQVKIVTKRIKNYSSSRLRVKLKE